MTVITTSTASTATAYSNQRKVDRTSNGVLWAGHVEPASGSASIYFSCSTDDGATWTIDVSGLGLIGDTYTANFSFFIDADDYAHLVYKHSGDGYIYYRRGTPNAGRTAWTWSAATAVYNNAIFDYPDIIAHSEGTGWTAHVVVSQVSGSFNATTYAPVTISSGGTITVGSTANIGGSYGVSGGHTYPSIDFNHTGDGKTVAGSTPHLYVAWSAGATGSGKGIRFKKATYSGGSWTWGTEREIDSTRYYSGDHTWGQCLFDGTRVVIGGHAFDGSAHDLILHERDAADTTTTTRLLLDNMATSAYLLVGGLSYDSNGNVYLLGRHDNEAAGSNDLVCRKWTRATATLEAETIIDAAVGGLYASVKRGYSSSRIEFIYTDGTASPYNITYGSVSLGYEVQWYDGAALQSATTEGWWDGSAVQTVTLNGWWDGSAVQPLTT